MSQHGKMHVANLHARGSVCPACLVQHHTRHRTVVHLKNTPRCLHLARAYAQTANGYGRQKEVASGAPLKLVQFLEKCRLPGPLQQKYDDQGEVMAPALQPPPDGYATPRTVRDCQADDEPVASRHIDRGPGSSDVGQKLVTKPASLSRTITSTSSYPEIATAQCSCHFAGTANGGRGGRG